MDDLLLLVTENLVSTRVTVLIDGFCDLLRSFDKVVRFVKVVRFL